MERRLGRGLESLLGSKPNLDQPAPSAAEPPADTSKSEVAASGSGTLDVPIHKLQPNPHQPRTEWNAESLDELRASIEVHGILQPICVREVSPEGTAGARYEIIAGERRWRAARLASLPRVPVVVRPGVTDRDMLELAVVENVQREDLDAIEKAKAYKDMGERLGLTQEATAERLGIRRATVANQIRLLELPDAVQRGLSEGLLRMGHARALLGLKQPKAILTLFQETVRKGLSVRQVEERVRALSATTTPAAADAPKPASRPAWVNEMEARIRESLGAKVQIRNRDGYRGEITLQYHDRGDLDRLLEHLAPPKTI